MISFPAGELRLLPPHAAVLLADNPGPMTLDGTNSYVLAGPQSRSVIIVDPGPDDERHLRRLAGIGPVDLILITHRHADHTAGAKTFAALTGAPVRAADPEHCFLARPLVDGELITAAGLTVRVIATPGHTTDSVCFEIVAEDGAAPGAVLTGDTILGRGTTVIAHPDGALRPYLDSLDRLSRLGSRPVLPAHGPDLPDLAAVCRAYSEHRRQRLAAVRAVVAELGPTATVAAVTDAVYHDIDPSVRPAVELSVQAQLDYLIG